MQDGVFMSRALELAAGVEGRTAPRPPVGAVVVDRAGRIAGEGASAPHPGPHAEVLALRAAGRKARGATIYVTLEPCAHTGATPPCADAVIAAGVGRVVAAVRDPNPLVRGRGFARLRSAGVEVVTGPGRARAASLLEPFRHVLETGRPFVTLKAAQTLDGKVAAPDGTSQWITSEEARLDVHSLRRRVDAVMVGAGTVSADDPSLTCRLPGYDGPQPMRVVCDSSGRTSVRAKVFDGRAPVTILTTKRAPSAKRRAWEKAGASVVVVEGGEDGIDLAGGLTELGRMGVLHVLCEGGPRLAASLVADDLAGRFLFYLAPKLVGGDAPSVLGWGVKTISDAHALRVTKIRHVGPDLCIEGRPA